MALLSLENVSKTFGGVMAVKSVSLQVEPGEVLGVMGPNGSGKTTLFNLVSGALVPNSGTIRFKGAPITGLPPHRICRQGIARTFQLVRPFLGLTARQNILVGLGYGCRPLSGSAAREKSEELLASVGLEGLGDRPASTLTAMDRKRLDLARALATSPDLLLLDEFMAGLNPQETSEAMGLIRRLQARGLTLVLVEHIVWALLELSQRIVVLSAGEKIAEGPPTAIARDPRVVEIYLGSIPFP
ncbi:MAG: ABC transporter ATP-binding protein [Candidatus Tectomicrobia bacterium]|uniref:ABC transporter ATP-binding protein n=1 Tax=Tectimicrobiota bacterium TaxID=2528274 RepID=A0A932GNP9_UNCTE|nr:ABC transporter ATP-binding protein [Candidatus Tectomicrobia bacterium]